VRLCGASVSGNRPSGQGRMAGGPGRGREGRPGHPRWILRGSERNRGSRRGICADGARRAVRGRGRAGGGRGHEGRGAPGERTVSRGGEAREADMRGEGSWSGEGVPGKAMLGAESVALSFVPRLLPPPACPSLPRPLSLLSALARSARPIPFPCPSRSSPSSFPLLPRVGFAFSRPSLCWTGFPCGHSRGKPCPPGLFGLAQPGPRRERSRGVPVFHRVAGLAPGNPDRSRRWIPPGPGGPKAARRPHGRVTVLVAVLVTVLVTVLASTGVGGRRGGRGESGRVRVFSSGSAGRSLARSRIRERAQNPGIGSRRDPGSGGGVVVSGPSSGISNGISSGISNGISNGTRGREGWGDGAGRREIGRVRLSSSGSVGKGLLTSGSGERDQNPGNGSLCSRRHGRRQKTGAGTDGRGRAHPGGPRKPQAIASAPPSNGISSGISNGISSGILWRASRMAGADEGTRRPWAMAPPSPPEGSRLARVRFPRPDPGVSGGFPRRSGIALAMQSRGIHSRSARAQPGVSRDPGEGPGTESAVGAGRPDPGRFPGDPPRNPRGWARRRGRRPEEGARAPSTPPARGARGRHEGGGDRKSEGAPFGDAPARRG
jgi:hypothetical protein